MMTPILIAAGAGQLGIAAGSLAIPAVLHWREDTARLRPLTRQVFWTYAGYIWSINVCMGAVSALKPQWLLELSGLARAVTAFIALYWSARVVIQFTYFDTSDAPSGVAVRVGEYALDCVFVCLAAVYIALTVGVR